MLPNDHNIKYYQQIINIINITINNNHTCHNNKYYHKK